MFDSTVIEHICFSCDYDYKYQLISLELERSHNSSNVYTVIFVDKDNINNVYQTTVQFDQQYNIEAILDQVHLLTN